MTSSVISSQGPAYTKLENDDGAKGERGLADVPGFAMRRNYDICMVFKLKTSKMVKYEEREGDLMVNRVLVEPTADARSKMQMWKQRREAILKSLQNCGLNVFCYFSRDRDEVIVKVGASAQKLRDTAARMKHKLQLKKQYLNAYAEYRSDFPGRPERQFKDRRVISHIYKTHTEDDYPDSDAIFKTLDKITIINHIITSKDKDCAGIPIGNLLHEDELRGYFPLHEGHVLRDLKESKWQWLLMPEDHANKVRDYFGDRIAFYFLFLGFYWKWLVPIAILGLALQFIDILARTPDNMTAIPFCILMSVWSTFLPYFWRRQEAKYAIGWGTLDLVENLEPCRPQYYGEPRINPVTAQVEPHFPWQRRLPYYICSAFTLMFCGVALCGVILLLLLARHEWKAETAGGILTFEILVAIFVEVMNSLLTRLARKLTNMENHRTHSDHIWHMLVKVMGLKFFNSYFVLYYIAFMKKHSELLGIEMSCLRDDCFLDLQSQLAVFVVFRFTVANLIQHLYPKFLIWWRSLRGNNNNWQNYFHGNQSLELADMSQAEQQAKKPPYDAFSNFDETLITHGYSTLFAVTSPWVCTATLFGTVFEIYINMKDLCDTRQRPIPFRARNNGPWSMAFDIYGVLAASTNVFLLIFASSEYETWTFTEKLTLFVYLEHMIFLARLLLKIIFPEVPRNVELLQLKQEHTVHRCLENIKVEQNQDFSMFRDSTHEHIEIFENDLNEEDDVEPRLQLGKSAQSMYKGVLDVMRKNPE